MFSPDKRSSQSQAIKKTILMINNIYFRCNKLFLYHKCNSQPVVLCTKTKKIIFLWKWPDRHFRVYAAEQKCDNQILSADVMSSATRAPVCTVSAPPPLAAPAPLPVAFLAAGAATGRALGRKRPRILLSTGRGPKTRVKRSFLHYCSFVTQAWRDISIMFFYCFYTKFFLKGAHAYLMYL